MTPEHSPELPPTSRRDKASSRHAEHQVNTKIGWGYGPSVCWQCTWAVYELLSLQSSEWKLLPSLSGEDRAGRAVGLWHPPHAHAHLLSSESRVVGGSRFDAFGIINELRLHGKWKAPLWEAGFRVLVQRLGCFCHLLATGWNVSTSVLFRVEISWHLLVSWIDGLRS